MALPGGRQQGARLDPTNTLVSAARFYLSFDAANSREVTFSELSGIVSEVEATEYMSSGVNGVTLGKQFGKNKPPSVTLKRGVDQDLTLWNWHQDVLAGIQTARRGCTLTLCDSSGVPKQVYNLLNAWPTKLSISGMKAGGSETAIAEVTLTCEQITLDDFSKSKK
jgi:phage tail-like protein